MSSGGHIHAYAGSVVTIINSTLLGGAATTTGGCIYTEGALSLVNSQVGGCLANDDGGCIYATGTAPNVSVVNTTISGCTSRNGRGGAIFAASQTGDNTPYGAFPGPFQGQIYVTSSRIDTCTALGDGGGIYGGTVYVYNSVLTGLSAGGNGGAVFALFNLDVISSELRESTAPNNGGCIYVGDQGVGTSSGIAVFYFGGSIAVFYLRPVTVTDTVFRSCSAGQNGGAIYATLDVVISESEFQSNVASVNGGAVYVSHSVISRNEPIDPATGLPWGPKGWMGNLTLYANPPASQVNNLPMQVQRIPWLNISACVFGLNVAQTYGGAVAAAIEGQGALTIVGSAFTGNRVQNAIGRGGAVAAFYAAFSLASSVFSFNTAPTLGGGAIFFGAGKLAIDSSSFSSNDGGSLFGQGGALHFQTTMPSGLSADTRFPLTNSLAVASSVFQGNSVRSTADPTLAASFESSLSLPDGFDIWSNVGSGGAIFVKLDPEQNVTVTIVGSSFLANTATSGGALSMQPSQTPGRSGAPMLTISGCLFDGNSARNSGGAAALGASASTVYPFAPFAGTVSGCTFSNNFAAYGGVLALQSSGTFYITSSTFLSNVGVTGGIFSFNATTTMLLSLSNASVSGSAAQFGAFAAILGSTGLAVQLDAVAMLNQAAAAGALYYTAPGVLVVGASPPLPPLPPLPPKPPPPPLPPPRPPNFPGSGLPAGPFTFEAFGNSSGFVNPLDNAYISNAAAADLIETLVVDEELVVTTTSYSGTTIVTVHVDLATPPSPPFPFPPPYPPPQPPAPPVSFPSAFGSCLTCTYSNISASRYGSTFASAPVNVIVSPRSSFFSASGVALPTISITLTDFYSQLVQEWPDLVVILSAVGPAQPPSSSVPNGLSGPLQIPFRNGAATFAGVAVRDVVGAAYNLTFTLSSPTIGALGGRTVGVTAVVAPCSA